MSSPAPAATPPVRLGLVCLNNQLREATPTVFSSRTVSRAHFSVAVAKERAAQNLVDLKAMLQWNESRPVPIRLFRVSSDMFPRITDATCDPYDIDFARPALAEAGAVARRNGVRLLMHPGQYNQVGAEKEAVFDATARNLSHECDILDALGAGDEGVLIVHGGGTYGDKAATKARWVRQFALLPERVRRRLALENCERQYSVRDVLDMCQQMRIPMIYDAHHHACYERSVGPIGEDPDDFIADVVATWRGRACERPVCHVSEQAAGKAVGAHSDFVRALPAHVLAIPARFGVGVDVEIEAKEKERAIEHLHRAYPDLFPPRSPWDVATEVRGDALVFTRGAPPASRRGRGKRAKADDDMDGDDA